MCLTVIFKTARGVGELAHRFGRQRVDAVATVEAHHRDAPLRPLAFFYGDKTRQTPWPPSPLFVVAICLGYLSSLFGLPDHRHAGPQRQQIGVDSEADDLTSHDWGNHRKMPKLFTGVNIRHVNLDDRPGKDRQRIA